MTNYYLWYSAEREAKRFDPEQPVAVKFNGKAEKPSICLYTDSEGEPVRVSFVSSDPAHGSGYADVQLVDVVKDAHCMATQGALQAAGQAFCEKNNIPPDFASLAAYVEEKGSISLGHAVSVHKPLRLKT